MDAIKHLEAPAASSLAQRQCSTAVVWLAHAHVDLLEEPEASALLARARPFCTHGSPLALVVVEQSRAAMLRGDGDTALALLDEAIAVSPSAHYNLLKSLVGAWLDRSEAPLAQVTSQGVGRLPPSLEQIPLLLQLALMGAEGEEAFSSQIASFPGEQSGWFVYALWRRNRHDMAGARELLEQAERVCVSRTLLDPPWRAVFDRKGP